MAEPAIYIHLVPGCTPPEITSTPSKFIVVIESDVGDQWRNRVSDWMVAAGCLYMMAWGRECSAWDDAVDWANIARCGNGPIPDSEFVVTTWHEDEQLSDVFWFSRTMAKHSCVDLARTVILAISTENRERELLGLYENI